MITFGAAIAVAAQPQAARQARRTGENDADETIPHLTRIRASPKTWHDIKATDAIAAIAAEYALNELSGKKFRVAGWWGLPVADPCCGVTGHISLFRPDAGALRRLDPVDSPVDDWPLHSPS
jgi:hypothetical protein